MELIFCEHWREKLGIEIGMSKEEGLSKFKEWQGTKKICQRCSEDLFKYREYCPVRLICEEAENGIEGRSAVLRKESRASSRSVEVNALRTTPKRTPLDQPWG